jgi:hypothetical protein
MSNTMKKRINLIITERKSVANNAMPKLHLGKKLKALLNLLEEVREQEDWDNIKVGLNDVDE